MMVNLLTQVWLIVTSLTKVTNGTPPQLSVEVTLAGLGAGTNAAHCTVVLAGHVIDGNELSNTVIVCVHVEEF